MNAKDLLQKAWVIEVAVLVAFSIVGVIALGPERFELFLRALPLLTALIGGQGIIAGVGPEVKRYIESRGQDGSSG